MTPTRNSNIQLLATLADFEDEEESEYRFLVDGKHVKDDRTFAPILLPTLPSFPPGDWNEGHVSKNPLNGELEFSRCTRSDLPGVSNTWHHTRIDHLELNKVSRIRQNIHVVTHPLFDQALLVKFTEFPWQMPFFEAETTAYEWIDGHDIGPKFLGHLTEDGRVIGFVLEYLDDIRSAETEDLAACQAALAKLHSLGIKHGDINKYNFLIRQGKAVLVDFEAARKCSQEKELQAEYERLEQSLRDDSRRGAAYVL
ncbi:alpha-galactosidase a precursor [Metarhizium brunneum]